MVLVSSLRLRSFIVAAAIAVTATVAFAKDVDLVRARITDVSVTETQDEQVITISADRSINYTGYLQEKPWKLVLEFPVVDFGSFVGEKNIGSGFAKKYVVEQQDRSENFIGRMEISFPEKPSYSVDIKEKGVVVHIRRSGKAEASPVAADARAQALIGINNVIFSGEPGKFIIVVETTGKPEAQSYLLKDPLRLVFDIQNSRYNVKSTSFPIDSAIARAIRTEAFPTFTRFVVDLAGAKAPVYLTKAESDKLIVTLTEESVAAARTDHVLLDSVDFTHAPGKASFRLKNVGQNEVKPGKAKDTVIAFDISKVKVDKDVNKTFDTHEFSDIVTKFTIYQLPNEDNKARFVVFLKNPLPYTSRRDGNDLLVEFAGEGKGVAAAPVAKAVKESGTQKAPAAEQEAASKTVEVRKDERVRPVIVSIKPAASKTDDEKAKKVSAESLYKGRPVTLTLKDADIQNIFKLLSEVAKLDGETLNIVTSDDVKGKMSIQLEEVPWDQVMDIILDVNSLAKRRIGNILRIMPRAKLQQEETDLARARETHIQVENLVLEIVPISYAELDDMKQKVSDILSKRGKVSVDKSNSSLVINDVKDNIAEAKKLIAKLDTPPKQVVIEARVVEASSDFTKEMGIQWGVKYFDSIGSRYRWGMSGASSRTDITGTQNFATGVGGSGGLNANSGVPTTIDPVPYFVNLPAAIGSGAGGGINFALVNLKSGVGLDIQLSAMENKGLGKILSRPKITTLNNVEASIQQGSSIPYETVSDKGTQTQFIDSVLQLTVTPRITPDSSIKLKVKVSNNNPNTALTSAKGVPSIDKNEAVTEVLVRNGQTIVIGGIIRQKETESRQAVPFFADIPILGWMFRHELRRLENRELMIFMTPHIVQQLTEVETQ